MPHFLMDMLPDLLNHYGENLNYKQSQKLKPQVLEYLLLYPQEDQQSAEILINLVFLQFKKNLVELSIQTTLQ
jgi:hypothetical protein